VIRNLFSIFDPATEVNNLPFNWISTAIGLLLIGYQRPALLPLDHRSRLNDLMSSVLFLLGDSPACEFYVPTFRNTPSVKSS